MVNASGRSALEVAERLCHGGVEAVRHRKVIGRMVQELYDGLLSRPDALSDFPMGRVESTLRRFVRRHAHRAHPSSRAGRFQYRNVDTCASTQVSEWAYWGNARETWAAYDDVLAHQESVRVVGECWGMSRLNHPGPSGRILLTSQIRTAPGRVGWASPGEVVRCELGATYDEVHAFLQHTGKVLENQPGFSGLTVAGNVGTGGHGSGLGMGPLGSMVERVVLGSVTGGSERVYERGHPDFDFVVTHLGRLGPVLSMDLRVVDDFRIAEERRIRVLGKGALSWREELPRLLKQAIDLHDDPDVHSTEIWIAPYVLDGELTCALGVRRRTHDPLTRATRPNTLDSKALQAFGHLAAVMIALGDPSWIQGALRRTVEATETRHRVVMSSREGLDFGAPALCRMASIEAGIDISDGIDRASRALIRCIELLASMAATERFVYSPMGIRFVGEGPADGLSPHAGRRMTMHIEQPTFAEDAIFRGNEVLGPLQEMLAGPEFDGRPHWGQRVLLGAEQMKRLWPERSRARMGELAMIADPKRRFASPFLDPVLDLDCTK